MRISSGLAALAAALILAGCDAVKVPGVDRSEDEAAQHKDSKPARTQDSDVANTAPDPTDAAGDSDPLPTHTAEIPTSDTADETGPVDMTGDGVLGPDETDASAPAAASEPVDPFAEIISLAEFNAVTCGLPADSEPTPTIAEVASASLPAVPEGPQPESAVFGTAAVGGIAARLTAFPGIVKMEPRNIRESGSVASGHCGATRINERWFVTAAHCVDEGYDEIRFIAGVENIRDDENAFVAKADMSICHAAYDGRRANYTNDIALLRLSEEDAARLGDVPVANIADTEMPFTPFNYPLAEMAGWGLTGFTESLSPVLLSAPLNVVSTGPGLVVISSRNGSGPCIGDSGGPLYVTEETGKKVVVGVLSVVEQNAEGDFCAGDYRGRYTNLQGYTDWLSNVTSVCDARPELCR